MSKKSVRKDDVAPDFFDPAVQREPVHCEVLKYLREATPTWAPFSPPERHLGEMALGVLLLARGIQVVDGPPPQIRLTHFGERWQNMLATNVYGDRTEGMVLKFVWLAWKDAQSDADRPAGDAKAQDTRPSTVGDPKRIYTKTMCPNCGVKPVKYLSTAQFAERARHATERWWAERTIRYRVTTGKYCTNPRNQLPWCAACQEKTPEGFGLGGGAREGHGEKKPSRAADYAPPANDCRAYETWVREAIGEGVAGAADLRKKAYARVVTWSRRTGGALGRDEVTEIVERVLKEHAEAQE
jgi:hypothetical protein